MKTGHLLSGLYWLFLKGVAGITDLLATRAKETIEVGNTKHPKTNTSRQVISRSTVGDSGNL